MSFLATMGIGLAGGIAQTITGAIQQKKNQQLLDNLQTPDLNNVYENMQVSTIGSDLMREESARGMANGIDALRGGGIRSVMGGLPQLVNQQNNMNNESRLYLDNQVRDRDYAIAKDNEQIRRLTENRYLGEVQGLGNAIAVGQQNMWGGIRGIAGSAMYGARNGALDGIFGGGGSGSAFSDMLNNREEVTL